MIVADSGPLVSGLNRRERNRQRFAAEILSRHAPDLLVPWPVLTEVDFVIRSFGLDDVATLFLQRSVEGDLWVYAPDPDEVALAVWTLKKYQDQGIDLADAVVMAVSELRSLPIFTWDFRHFRAAKRSNGQPFDLLIQEHELPGV